MPPDPAQPRLFTPIETPHPPRALANAKNRLAAALMLRFAAAHGDRREEQWTPEMEAVLLALLSVVQSGVEGDHGALLALWRKQMSGRRMRRDDGARNLGIGLVDDLITLGTRRHLADLVEHLARHECDARAWTLEIGWIARRHLPRDIRPALFEAFGGTLSDADESLALAYAVSTDGTEFWQAAEAYRPKNHAEQYRQRLHDLRPYSTGLRSGFRLGEVEARATALMLDELARL